MFDNIYRLIGVVFLAMLSWIILYIIGAISYNLLTAPWNG